MTDKTIRTKLRSDELSCPSCVPKIESALRALPGVKMAEVKFGSGRIEVEHDPALSDVAALVSTIAKTGYTAKPSAF
ncbi:MAG: heavy-metal-associated domain-containing protein [Desulfomicrobium sp.]|uniref:heavy-metal-associated domain-containing protein n=1 Tax=Hyphomicrobiales TaxID=356 RepID=UPI0025BA019F|nr:MULTISPECIES: heavy-metal-associated domain-containing protein [Hyphomicrobiales]MBU4527098.1 heavy-metal-associated domain-containing protein [Alphaproteobacteria bacterium]MBV1711089.1 heavy-metal-associated domain-containing protein [Desulfomicrobium sp.]MBU4544109.1 heavy-metal-associated domain-containing protein [Alphaproteobacteria bacterium]MBU4548427.1 heavy-metal-associated domain-containing protein [Alphaproteobacteria bacterium]MBV1785638.1 heavy-metal-associated domain-containi